MLYYRNPTYDATAFRLVYWCMLSATSNSLSCPVLSRLQSLHLSCDDYLRFHLHAFFDLRQYTVLLKLVSLQDKTALSRAHLAVQTPLSAIVKGGWMY